MSISYHHLLIQIRIQNYKIINNQKKAKCHRRNLTKWINSQLYHLWWNLLAIWAKRTWIHLICRLVIGLRTNAQDIRKTFKIWKLKILRMHSTEIHILLNHHITIITMAQMSKAVTLGIIMEHNRSSHLNMVRLPNRFKLKVETTFHQHLSIMTKCHLYII